MRIDVDRDLCISSGLCVMRVPDVFDQDDLGLVSLLTQEPPAHLESEVREAARICPARAIEELRE